LELDVELDGGIGLWMVRHTCLQIVNKTKPY